MKYVKIKNKGHIDARALTLVGVSSKRDDSTKIGRFGSGNKYALAYLLRNKYIVKIFAGKEEIFIETKQEEFRGHIFNRIYVNGEQSSITTEMGVDWQFWQAVRELYCNAIDEGEASIECVNDIIPAEGETHVYFDIKTDVMDFFSNFDNYFAENKEILFEGKYGRILKKTGSKANIYRKGIRCHETNLNSSFDYDFHDISIDENRLIKYSWEVSEYLWRLIFSCTNKEVFRQILIDSNNPNNIESNIGDYITINSSYLSCEAEEVIRNINVAPQGFAGLLKPDEVHQFAIVPTKVYTAIRGKLGHEQVGDRFDMSRNGSVYRIIQPDSLALQTIKEANEFLKECGFVIPYNIKVAVFDNKKVFGTIRGDDIILSDVGLTRGINETVNTILEEFIHIKYGVEDETRSFQTAIITEFIEYMKRKNAYSI